METTENNIVIDYAGIQITDAELAEIQQINPEIRGSTLTIKIHPELEIKLTIAVKRIQHQYRLGSKNGINRTSLIHLLLKKALSEVTI